MDKTRARFLKHKAEKIFILNESLYWKELGKVLLNCVIEQEAKRLMKDFHARDCGGH